MNNKIIVILTFFLLFSQTCESNEAKYPFQPDSYDPNNYNVTSCTYDHGLANIIITQVKTVAENRNNLTSPPRVCRAWIEVQIEDRTSFKTYFSDIDPVGYSYGIFVPDHQPSPDYFIAVKFGDYDGRIFIISKNGEVIESQGGLYFITHDKRYIFVEYSSDISMLQIFDLNKGKEIFKSDNIPYIQNWYYKDGKYMFTESEWVNAPTPTEKKGVAYVYDFDSNQFIEEINKSILKDAKKIEYDFDPRVLTNCCCKE